MARCYCPSSDITGGVITPPPPLGLLLVEILQMFPEDKSLPLKNKLHNKPIFDLLKKNEIIYYSSQEVLSLVELHNTVETAYICNLARFSNFVYVCMLLLEAISAQKW